ncbi:MAG: DUF4012 domain-containing protein [Patescibacteria group bacterium]
MGENKTYYYIKKKPRSQDKQVHFFNNRPEVVLQPNRSPDYLGHREQVLDLEFHSSRPQFWIGLARWSLLVVFASLVYMTGALLYTGGGVVKEEIVRKGEAAAANLQQGADALKQLDISTALSRFQLAQRQFDSTLELLAELGQSPVLSAGINLPDSEIWQSQALLSGGRHLAIAGVQLMEAVQPLVSYWSGLTSTGGNLRNSGEVIGQMLIDNSRRFDSALIEVQLASDILSQLNSSALDPTYGSLVAEAQGKTQALGEAMEILGNLAKKLPKALGFGNPQYYLLLNQNSNELRPTGGFIGSIVLVRVYHGKIEQISPDTTQRLDGQNKYTDITLPTPLKAVTAYFGLRDANWEPNFPTSVRTIQKLYQQAGGGSVDGVIALTPGVITDILAVTGPLLMPEYGFSLTADNFVEKTQQQIEVIDQDKYNPKQVLLDLVPVLMDRVMNSGSQELQAIGDRLFQRLVDKDILIYSTDAQLEAAVASLGWSGEINPIGGQDDYLYVVDANLGGNKSSSSIVREISLKTMVNPDTTVVDTLSLKYTHTGTDIFPDGVNKNYVRVYLPMGSHITTAIGQDEGTQVDIDSSDGKTVVGFWLTTKPGNMHEVKLEYELPFKLKFINGQALYNLMVQKQPGSERTVLSSYIEVGDNMDLAVKSSNEAIRKDMTFSDKLAHDETITATVRKYK